MKKRILLGEEANWTDAKAAEKKKNAFLDEKKFYNIKRE